MLYEDDAELIYIYTDPATALVVSIKSGGCGRDMSWMEVDTLERPDPETWDGLGYLRAAITFHLDRIRSFNPAAAEKAGRGWRDTVIYDLSRLVGEGDLDDVALDGVLQYYAMRDLTTMPSLAEIIEEVREETRRMEGGYEAQRWCERLGSHLPKLSNDADLGEAFIYVRTWNVIRSHIQTAGEVRRMSDKELLAIPGVGRKTLAELREVTWS